MLIKCPRCGFQQPQDKYCAQCGVDMESFTPPTTPLMKRLISNPLAQLSLLLIVVSGLGVYIYQRGQQNLQQRVSYLKSTVQINSSNLNPPPPPPPMLATENASTAPPNDASSTDSKEPNTETAVVDANKKNLPATRDLSTAANKEADSKDLKTAAKTTASHLNVYYAEVGRNTLNSLFEASQSTGQFMSFKDYTAGILPNIEKRMSGANIKILHKEVRTLDSLKTLQWFYGLKDRRHPAVEIGLTTFFELSDIDANNLRGNLEIQRTWREPASTGGFEVQRKSFPAIFEIGSGTGFFMSGVMPTQSLLENEDELMTIDVYKILNSPQFRSGDSDFVIFVDFNKGN